MLLWAIVFVVVGYRSTLLKLKHFIWVAAIALLPVFSAINTGQKLARNQGMEYVIYWPQAIAAWLYVAAVITAGLLLGLWIGRWRRVRLNNKNP